MTDKSIISFFANILIGIIFILPVYSFSVGHFEINTHSDNFESYEFLKSTTNSDQSGFIDYTAVIPIQIKINNFLFSSSYKNSFNGFFTIKDQNLLNSEFKPPPVNLNNQDFFTKITFLNTLGTVKFLC